MLLQREENVFGDGHAVEERGVLEDEAEARPLRGNVPFRKIAELPAVELDVPVVGGTRPMIVFSSTVLPQPLSPITASVCPAGTLIDTSRSTVCRPKRTLRLCRSIKGEAATMRFSGSAFRVQLRNAIRLASY